MRSIQNQSYKQKYFDKLNSEVEDQIVNFKSKIWQRDQELKELHQQELKEELKQQQQQQFIQQQQNNQNNAKNQNIAVISQKFEDEIEPIVDILMEIEKEKERELEVQNQAQQLQNKYLDLGGNQNQNQKQIKGQNLTNQNKYKNQNQVKQFQGQDEKMQIQAIISKINDKYRQKQQALQVKLQQEKLLKLRGLLKKESNIFEDQGGDAAGFHKNQPKRIKNAQEYKSVAGQMEKYLQPKNSYGGNQQVDQSQNNQKDQSNDKKGEKSGIKGISSRIWTKFIKKYQPQKKKEGHKMVTNKEMIQKYLQNQVKDKRIKEVKEKEKQDLQAKLQVLKVPQVCGGIPKYKEFKNDFFQINNRNLIGMGRHAHAQYLQNYLYAQQDVLQNYLYDQEGFNLQGLIDPFIDQENLSLVNNAKGGFEIVYVSNSEKDQKERLKRQLIKSNLIRNNNVLREKMEDLEKQKLMQCEKNNQELKIQQINQYEKEQENQELIQEISNTEQEENDEENEQNNVFITSDGQCLQKQKTDVSELNQN
ncbi:hypothetical protein PPERSA_07233 [Pseudocohnilembus persalinus]|uniref:Uncharacterized protein n=1 Tax=Pseudocohnilembus persalinus TaxID=266149 RepID=A0A0V0QCU1_PSEPJ|nr:hypothetical protein PPERSA_07233 [Pseudocohnilembus persalinus]|eukprot:KRX00036.1 hypothetical protein PPERSA_07233 [Pseudocohnilembus persalinus]